MTRNSIPVNRWLMVTAVVALIAVPLLVYHDIGSHEFIEFDDFFFLEAPHVRDGLTLDGVKKAFTTQRGMWFPLTWLSHMADSHLYGDDPAGHYYTNLLLHTINTVLLFLVLYRMTGAFAPSLMVGVLFAVHPLNTETVACIACRKGLLSTLFWILSMGAYMAYSRSPSVGRYLLTAVLLFLGMMAKPMLLSLPVIFLLLDYWPLGRFRHETVTLLVKEKMPLLAISLAFLGITIFIQQQTGAVSSLENLPIPLRIENALVSYVLYIYKLFWPVSLAVFYPFPKEIPWWQWSGSAALLVLVTVKVYGARGSAPHAFTGWLWFLVSLVPVIGLIKVGQHAMADRYAYIPLVGLFIALIWSLPGYASSRPAWSLVLWGLPVTAAMVLGVVSFRQAALWKDSVTLFEHALSISPESDVVHNNLGKVYFDRGDFSQAQTHIGEALRISPHSPQANYNMGMLQLEKKNVEGAGAYFSRAVELEPDFPEPRYALAHIFFSKGDFDNALNHYMAVLKKGRTASSDLMAETHNDMGVIYATRKKMDVARDHFQKALALNPGLAAAHNNLGLLLFYQEDTEGAETHFRKSIALDPGFLDAINNLVNLYKNQGKYPQAIALLERSLAERPDSAVSIYYNISCLYAIQNDKAAAVEWLEKAVEKGFNLWQLLAHDADLENIRDTTYYRRLMMNRRS